MSRKLIMKNLVSVAFQVLLLKLPFLKGYTRKNKKVMIKKMECKNKVKLKKTLKIRITVDQKTIL